MVPRDSGLVTRRELLAGGVGLGTLALAGLLGAEEERRTDPLAPRRPHFSAKAKRVLHIFANGGPSQVDTFDPKPMLARYEGKPLPKELHRMTQNKTGNALASPFKFPKCGRSGIEISEIFPRLSECADDLCVIRSMHADFPFHDLSIRLMNCGENRQVRPSLGSWTTYGLGTERRDLPGFVVLSPGYPVQGPENWRSAFLPGIYQGTHINPENPVPDLIRHLKSADLPAGERRRQLDLLLELNRRYQERREEDALIEARIQTFELAYRMQAGVLDAFDVSKEPEAIRTLYGPGIQGRQLLMARRLLERGVRFVQIFHGHQQPWDTHGDNAGGHKKLAQASDPAYAALLRDLKQRGLLEDTLVLWGGEFGRTPTSEGANGRDHNHWGFSVWMAGGGVKGGTVHGATDDFGFAAVDKPVHVHDLHATILHLLGFDHEKLTYRYAGRDFRLTDVRGQVVKEVLA